MDRIRMKVLGSSANPRTDPMRPGINWGLSTEMGPPHLGSDSVEARWRSLSPRKMMPSGWMRRT